MMYMVPFDEPILTPEMWEFWEENGYVMIPNAVPQENLDAAIAAVWEFLEMDPDDPGTWYGYRPRGGGFWRSPISAAGMVEFYHHQTLWDIRQHPRIYQSFAELLGERRLWVTYDRVNLLPPARADLPAWSGSAGIHWDCETTLDPVPFQVQGVLYLTDTAANQGGFRCIPGFHKVFPEWRKTQPADRHPNRCDGIDQERYPVQAIPGKAGDLLIWTGLLPHGNGGNTSDKPRMAQYITMSTTPPDDQELRTSRYAWQERVPIANPQGDPRGREKRQPLAELTELGQRLIGFTPWD